MIGKTENGERKDEATDKVLELYDAGAALYEDFLHRAKYFSPEWISEHVNELEPLRECHVLDLGCGTGVNVRALCARRAGIHAVGVDLSPKMIEFARAEGKYEKLHTYDLHKPLQDLTAGTFDLVIAFGVFELLADLTVCLSECHRVLKVNGRLWATFGRFEPDDEGSPPRHTHVMGLNMTSYSAGEILHMISKVDMRLVALDPIVGYITRTGFARPYYMLQAYKMK